MPPAHFSVTQVRVAASCPRILYFDHAHTRQNNLKTPRVTRIWKTGEGNEAAACGALFHHTVERFHRHASSDPALHQLLDRRPAAKELADELVKYVYCRHLDLDKLFQKDGQQQANFMAALRTYLGELAHLLAFALAHGRDAGELLDDLFGERRKRVDVTFEVGPHGEPVHLTGALDYFFRDARTDRLRILDYKLTPADQPANDLFQVCIYALMHNVMHGTEADAGVLYLHPRRELVERPWPEIHAERGKVFNLLASMRAWIDYDEQTGAGLKPPGEPSCCPVCPWRNECVERLGPKDEGDRLDHWTPAPKSDPPVTVREPAPAPPEPEPPPPTEAPGPSPDDTPPPLPGDDHLNIGSAGDEPVSLPRTVLPTHLAVVGAAGSGKTWLAKVLAEEAVLLGIPVLAIDPQGDLVQFLQARDPAEVPPALRDRHASFRRRAEPRVWTPGSSHGLRLCLSPLRLARDADLAAIPDPARRAEEREGMLASLASNLVGLARAGGEQDSQQTFVLQLLRRLADAPAGPRTDLDLGVLTDAVKDPEPFGIDPDAFVKKAEREKLARKLNSLRHGPSANLFTGGSPLDLDRFCRPASPGKVPLNVVYLNALTGDDQKQFFVAALAEEVYRWMITSGGAGAARLLVYLDEARDYIPAGSAKPPAKMPLIRLFTQGRKYGVGCLMCTQSPRSVDYNVFGNCSTKLIGRLESAQDAERVSDWFTTSGPAPAWVRQRAGADPGTFVGRWPGMPAELEGATLRSRMLFSLHEGAWPPDRVERAMREHPQHLGP